MKEESAFPTFVATESGNIGPDRDGMTLRDYFAARAMQGLVHDILIDQPTEDSLIEKGLKPESFPGYLAHLAYRTAEAMIAERVRPAAHSPELVALLKRCLPIVQQYKSPGLAMSDPWTRPNELIAEISRVIAE